MVKQLKIMVAIDEEKNKVATIVERSGWNMKNISSHFEIIGILENLVNVEKDKLKVLFQEKK